jgi:hypothetical protein
MVTCAELYISRMANSPSHVQVKSLRSDISRNTQVHIAQLAHFYITHLTKIESCRNKETPPYAPSPNCTVTIPIDIDSAYSAYAATAAKATMPPNEISTRPPAFAEAVAAAADVAEATAVLMVSVLERAEGMLKEPDVAAAVGVTTVVRVVTEWVLEE